MSKFIVRGIGISVAAGVAISLLGVPVAAADVPDVVGMRHSDAVKRLRNNGLRPVVGTVIGAALPLDECFVMGLTNTTVVDPMGRASQREVRVNLSCYARATNTNPGIAEGDTTAEADAVRQTIRREERRQRQLAQQQQSGG